MNNNLDKTVQEIVASKDFYEFVTMEICQHYIPGWKSSPYAKRSRRIRKEGGVHLELTDRQKDIVAGHAFTKGQWHEILYGFWLGLNDLVALYAREEISPSLMCSIRDLYDFYDSTLEEIKSCFTKSGRFCYKKYRAAFNQAYGRLSRKESG